MTISYIEEALKEAQKAKPICAPNPAVGAILVGENGQIIGRGHTQKKGEAHAEIMAINDAKRQNYDVKNATIYVTLEPCSHHGRTPPCCDALIQAGIRKVVACLEDPNPLVAGRGFARLLGANIDVVVGERGDLAHEINLGFFSRMKRQKPWIRAKIAASVDGFTALSNGQSQWITSALSREDTQLWRSQVGSILTGIGTVLSDNPLLNVRLPNTIRQPHLVVVDSQLRIPSDARLFSVARSVLIYTTQNLQKRYDTLQAIQSHNPAAHVEIIGLENQNNLNNLNNHRVNLNQMMFDLAKREINDIHVEAGSILNGALIQADLIDEYILYLAPQLLGSGRGLAQLKSMTDLNQAICLKYHEIKQIGDDLRIIMRPLDRANF